MGANGSPDLLKEYVHILRGFGLTRDEIRALHECSERFDRESVRERLLDRYDAHELTPEILYRSLHEKLVRSSRGIDARRRYWNHSPPIQLQEVVELYGCDITFLTPDGEVSTNCSTEDGPVGIELAERSTGRTRRTHFEYPATPLGDNNYPALVYAVEDELLDGAPLTFVLLSDLADNWRFVVVETDALETLQNRYGDRIVCFDRPLLRQYQPAAYATDTTGERAHSPAAPGPTAPAIEPSSGPDSPVEAALESNDTDSFQELKTAVDGGVRPGELTHGDGPGPDIDDLASAEDPHAVAERTPERNDRTMLGDDAGDDVEGLFSDLGNITPASEKSPPDDADPPAEPVDGAGRDGVATDGAPGGSFNWGLNDDAVAVVEDESAQGTIDEVFEHLEKEVATESIGKSNEVDADRVTSGDVLEAIDHHNAGEDATVEHGFIWVDPDSLTPNPEAVYAAMVEAN